MTESTITLFGAAFGFSIMYNLVPGPHYIVAVNQASYRFTITDDGHVTYDHSLQGRLTGNGGTTLGVQGFPVTIDARDSAEPSFSLDGVGTFDARQLQTARLLPIWHVVTFPSRRQYAFRVGDSGPIDYDHSLDAILSGRNSSTLIIRRRRCRA